MKYRVFIDGAERGDCGSQDTSVFPKRDDIEVLGIEQEERQRLWKKDFP